MIYTLEIAGRAVLAFEAASGPVALAIASDDAIQQDLKTLESGGTPLWDGHSPLKVRRATADETALFIDRVDGDDGDFVVFLVPVHEKLDDDGRDLTRH